VSGELLEAALINPERASETSIRLRAQIGQRQRHEGASESFSLDGTCLVIEGLE
jgi:hypothetical protein